MDDKSLGMMLQSLYVDVEHRGRCMALASIIKQVPAKFNFHINNCQSINN